VNAVDAAMHDELAHLFTDLQNDADSDLIILTGQGRAFCAGGDFDWFDEQIAKPATFRAIVPDAKRIVSFAAGCGKADHLPPERRGGGPGRHHRPDVRRDHRRRTRPDR